MARRKTDEWGWHWCNDHEPHPVDPYRHRHSWQFSQFMTVGDKVFAGFYCDCFERHTAAKIVEATFGTADS